MLIAAQKRFLRLNLVILLFFSTTLTAINRAALAGGDGGNITINAGFVVGVPEENSDITANAFFGRGGNINITTNALFGLESREQLTRFSDITAFSRQNTVLNGTVVINNLEIDPSRGLTELPSALTDPRDRIVAACPARPDTRFVVTGRGGLPEDPRATLRGVVVVHDFRTSAVENVEGEQVRSRGANYSPLPTSSPLGSRNPKFPSVPRVPPRIIEAQGWVIDAQGNVELVTNTTSVSGSSGSDGRLPCL